MNIFDTSFLLSLMPETYYCLASSYL